MVNACILVRVEKDSPSDAREGIAKLDGIKDVFYVFGRYDVVAYARMEDYPSLAKLAIKVNGVKGVRSTETLIEG